jgi:lipopolysaccharide/colanic/teichoic acid biosynthesis glycosyltransferase
MELIGVLIFAVLGILAAAISKQLTDEFKAWAPWIIGRIIERAVRNSPEDLRERLAVEWPSHVQEVPGDVGKLIVAFGFLSASWKLSSAPYVVTKRTLDVVLSAFALFMLGPLFVLIAVLIRLDSSGSVFVRRTRLGRDGKEFKIWKFRTMEGAASYRVTRVGKFLRRTSMDEIPQLINVLIGQMSLVGPRPRGLLDKEIPSVLLRHDVKPGIAGWAQLNGVRGERDSAATQNRNEDDLYYVNNRSLLLDLKILLTTIQIVFFDSLRK